MEVGDKVFDELKEDYQKVLEALRKSQDEEDPEAIPEEGSPKTGIEEALDILEKMQLKLEKIQDDVEYGMKIKCMLSSIHQDMASIYIEGGEVHDSKENAKKSLEILEGYELKPEGILIFMNASNRLYNIFWESGDHEDAKLIAHKANNTCDKYTKECIDENGKMIMPIGRCGLFGIEDSDNPKNTLNLLNIMALCFLAQVYITISDRPKAVLYSQLSIRNQLELPDCDYLYIAISIATMSQFFIERKVFMQARYHLAAASHVLNLQEESLNTNPLVLESEEIKGAKFEELHYRRADIARCWSKYGIALMKGSRERLLEEVETIEDEKFPDNFWNEMKFTKFEKEIKTIEAQVTDKYLLDFEDAKKVFLNIQKWLDEAKTYYTFDTHASDYVEIVQDHSEAYSHLVFFEDDEDRKAKMHKRRIDMLEEIIKNLNPKYYQRECRQVCYDLGDVYSSLCDIKWDKIKSKSENKTPHALNKVNHLAKSSIEYYRKFLESLEDSKASSSVVKFTDEYVPQALFSYLHIATLNNRLVVTIDDKKQKLEHMKTAHAAYQFIISYCEIYPDATKYVKTELVCCNELVPLLSKQILKLEDSIKSVS